MKILFRCDSSLLMGTGHLMRCLSLARLLREKHHEVSFLTRRTTGNVNQVAKDQGFSVTEWDDCENHENFETYDADQTEAFIKTFKPDWVILDHYDLGKTWEKRISHLAKIFVIDDLLREHDCLALLDQNYRLQGTDPKRQVTLKCVLFLGPEYVLLNEHFKNKKPIVIRPKVERVLIFFGGTDSTGETLRFLDTVSAGGLSVTWVIVIGKNNPDHEKIKALSEKNPCIELHIQTPDMASVMASCDLFVGAGGTVTWERCYLGLPAICIATASNQIKIAEDLASSQVHIFLGEAVNVSAEQVQRSIRQASEDVHLRETLHKNSLSLKVGARIPEIVELLSRQV
ncbi:MAG: UDP-2,4-diacetamido-2,4,6-trideoxy-beta-L-altropyranose hydrolase [Bacteriovoracia bacterium]